MFLSVIFEYNLQLNEQGERCSFLLTKSMNLSERIAVVPSLKELSPDARLRTLQPNEKTDTSDSDTRNSMKPVNLPEVGCVCSFTQTRAYIEYTLCSNSLKSKKFNNFSPTNGLTVVSL